MKLKDLLDLTSPEAGFSVAGLSHEQVSKIEVTGLTSDSRAVQAGNLFAALTGSREDGAAYIADAEKRGAVVAMAGAGAKANGASIPVLETHDPRLQLARAAAAFYNAQPETMVAVTGTAGKTSVASFTRQIWAAGGLAAASIGTTGIVSPSGSEYGALTTPDPVHLHQLLARLAGEGVTHAAFEASSHGLEQRRLDGVRLAAGGFTNLGHDHLDYHSTMEDYFDAKMRLFEALLPKRAPAVIYADDAWSRQAEDRARAAGLDCLTVGRSGTFLSLKRVEHERSRQSAEIHYADRFYRIRLPLAGDFQIANALVSAGLAMATGLDADTAIGALENLSGAPGRLELVGTTQQGAPVYVDYAHKPDALRQVLSSVRPFTTGRVMVVFGCGGDRDRAKRPMMGRIAEELSDLAIVTDDNPRSEDPAAIRAAILTEAPSAIEIADRRSAIREAIGRLGSGDTLVIAGKGHEEGQIVDGKTHPFSDHQEARAALEVPA